MNDVKCWNCGRSVHYAETAETSGHKTNEMKRKQKAKEPGKGKAIERVKAKSKGNLNNVENNN